MRLTLMIMVLALLGLPLVFGCTTPKPAMVDSKLSEQTGFEQQQQGLRIYIRPLRDKKEIKRYFGSDLLSKKILPVFVLAENRSDASFFLVEPADVYREEGKIPGKTAAKAEDGSYISAKDAKRSVYQKDAGPEGLLLLTPPIFWLGVIPLMAMDLDPGPTDASKSLQQALITNAPRKQTLTPGKSESGFLYYHLPDGTDAEKNVGINLRATNTETQDEIYFRFTGQPHQEGNNGKSQ